MPGPGKDWKELKRQAKAELEDFSILFKKAKRGLSAPEKEQARSLYSSLRDALRSKDEAGLKSGLEGYLLFKDAHFSQVRYNKTWELVKDLFWILLVVFLIRWIFIKPFRIPSGSMIPTLLVGDQLMVNKLVFGVQIPLTTKKLLNLKTPKRGDVIVFKYPPNPREDYVKRVVAVARDTIMVRDGFLFVNGKEVPRDYVEPYNGPSDSGNCGDYDLYVEKLDHTEHQMLMCHRSHTGDNYGPITVPDGNVFGMGDNRDNSADSRFWGFIPLGNIKGKALFIHLPLDPERHYLPRWNRFFKLIK